MLYDLHHISDRQDICGNDSLRAMDHIPSIQDFSAILFPDKKENKRGKQENKQDLEDAYWDGFFDGSSYRF